MIELKPNQATHICCLVTGDRFYFASDGKKRVWELRYHTTIRVKTGFKKFSVCKQGKGNAKRFDANRVIIFLRRTKPLIKRQTDYSLDRFFA